MGMLGSPPAPEGKGQRGDNDEVERHVGEFLRLPRAVCEIALNATFDDDILAIDVSLRAQLGQ